jgi:hypothetical protein
MELSRNRKILLGVASVWPAIYIFLFIAFIFVMIALSGLDGGRRDFGPGLGPMFGGVFVILMVVHVVTIFGSLALTVFYVIHAVKNPRLDSNMRIVWILLFFFGGMIAEPIYWYLQIWRSGSAEVDSHLLHGEMPYQYANPDAQSTAYVPPTEPPDWR